MTTFAAYTELGVFGVGVSRKEAIQTARAETRDPQARFKTAMISLELYRAIERDGWDNARLTFTVSGDTLTADGED